MLVAMLIAGLVFGADETKPEAASEPARETAVSETPAAPKFEVIWISIPKRGDISQAEVDFRLPNDELKSVKSGEAIDDESTLESVAWSASGEEAELHLVQGDEKKTLTVPGERVSQRGLVRMQTNIELASKIFEVRALTERSFMRKLRSQSSPENAELEMLDDALTRNVPVTLLSPPQAEAIAQFLTTQLKGSRPDVEFAAAPAVTTKSKQRAIIEIIRELRYPTEWSVDPLLPKSATPVAFETRNCGLTLEFEPEIRGESLVHFEFRPQLVEFLGMFDPESNARFPRKKLRRTLSERLNNVAMPKANGRPVKTVFSARGTRVQLDLLSGHSALLTGLAETDDVGPFDSLAPKGRLIVLVKATIVERPH